MCTILPRSQHSVNTQFEYPTLNFCTKSTLGIDYINKVWYYFLININLFIVRGKPVEEKKETKNLNMKFTDEDWVVLDALCVMYGGMDKTNMVRQALRHVLKTKPKFVLAPVINGKVEE